MSARTFGPQFRPQDFKGPLARHYSDRKDLFQQLGGAALSEMFPQRVSITSTKGGDGGIDVFVEAGADSAELFFGLRLPIIMECKDHDDSLGTVAHNVEVGWANVREKLARRAEAGWKGTYQPWRRAKGYLYCVSAVLHQQARDTLTESIREFFDSLPAEQKPSIEDVHVLDWSDLAPLLNSHARLADSWLGTELEGIIGHDAYDEGLSGFRLYLKEDRLSFIFPAWTDPAHPENLLVSLEQEASTAGILLVGPSGVGKTRTCFEVARLAHRKGWRVLHLLPGEPPVTAASLQEMVLQGSTPTLLVIDYLERMASLDLSTIRYRLFPETKARGIPLAILANARPGVLHKVDTERDALFRKIEIDIRDRRSQIAAHLQETIAPRASTILGSTKVREICGTRPIIGMFIAHELERYAKEGKLDESVVSRLRQGDLQWWIRRRFQEDGLLPQETHPLLPASPDNIMIAAAAGLAAAPLWRTEISRVVCKTLEATGEPKAEETAGYLVASLVRSGWMEEAGYYLTTAHDIVADELLDLTLCDRECRAVRGGIVDRVLIGALSMPSVLGRFSVSLDRVLGQEDSSGQLPQTLRETLEAWLVGHASEIGQMFVGAVPGEVSYALGAVVSGDVWSDTVIEVWNDLITPWLALHGRSVEARHLLYRGLKNLPEGAVGILADTSRQWLDVHRTASEAEFVLSSLLSRADLGEQAKGAIDAALAWLKDHGSEPDAQFVLAPLLSRADLGEQAKAATDAAFAWLKEHGSRPEARFLLSSLLSRADLGEHAKPAVDAALAWLKDHGSEPEAGFVLAPLLSRADLGEQAKGAIDAALPWLKDHGSGAGAGFVLAPLLSRADLGEQAKGAIDAALAWLKDHGLEPGADFVLRSLLPRADLGEQAKPTLDAAMAWLKDHGLEPGADFVLRQLLPRADLGEQAKPATDAAMAWLKDHGSEPEAGFVLAPLLSRADLGEHAKGAIDAALAWLKEHGSEPGAEFVLSSLLLRADLGEQAKGAIDAALPWLKDHGSGAGAGFVLAPLLLRADLGEHAKGAIDAALPWLKDHGSGAGAGFILAPLVARPDLGEQAKPAMDAAMGWLKDHGSKAEASHVLEPLLVHADLGEQTEPAIDAAMGWLEDHFLTQDAEFVLKSLLGKSHLSGDRRKRCITFALKRLDTVIETSEASFILERCLKERTLSGEEWMHAVGCALKWLRLNAEAGQMDFVFKRLLRNRNLDDKTWREVADYAFAWLRRTQLAGDRDYALNSLLVRPALLTPEERDFLVKDVEVWIGAFPSALNKEFLVSNLKRLTDGNLR
jgi:regulator of RNase E activity RraB